MNDKEQDIVLCLSGGGLRATYFHLGVMRWFFEHDLASRIKHIYSVSGGSIVAAHLAHSWLGFLGDPDAPFDQRRFEALQLFDLEADKLVQFGSSDVRGRVVRRWSLAVLLLFPLLLLNQFAWTPRSLRRFRITRLLEAEYGRLLTPSWSLKDLRHKGVPAFNLLATCLSTGELCAMSQFGIRRLKSTHTKSIGPPNPELRKRPPSAAQMVAASSAFPPLFPPVELTAESLGERAQDMQIDTLHLTDGGVYDNLGLGLALQDFRNAEGREEPIFVVSDASAPFDWSMKASFAGLLSRTVRTTDILMKRVAEFEDQTSKSNGTKELVRLSIEAVLDGPDYKDALEVSLQSALSKLRTDLDAFSKGEMGALAMHGHAVAHSGLSSRLGKSWTGSWAPPTTQSAVQIDSRRLLRQLDAGARRKLLHWKFDDWSLYVWLVLCIVMTLLLLLLASMAINKRSDQEKAVRGLQLAADEFGRLQRINADLHNENAQLTRQVANLSDPAPVVAPIPERHLIEKRTQNLPSGMGRFFSPPYEICSDPLPSNSQIVAAEFRLVGDRACGAWAECRETSKTPSQVCWSFSLQGHDEWFPPRPAFSQGVLTVTIESPRQ